MSEADELNAYRIGLQQQSCRSSFKAFVNYFWKVVPALGEFLPGYHTDAIIDHVDMMVKDKFSRLVINCPIRHGKSLLTSVFAPAWIQARNPTTRILSCTYRKDLTTRDALRTKELMESKEYQELFGFVSHDTKQDAKNYYINNHGGHRLSQSVQGGLGGFDADVVLLDDLISIKDRRSKVIREKVWDYFKMCVKRLVYSGDDKAILSGHRLDEGDMYSRLKADDEGFNEWVWLMLPAEANPDISKKYFNPFWTDPRKPGELLWPDRYTKKVLEKEKRDFGYEYPAVFQQAPEPIPGESLFQREWFKPQFKVQDGCYWLKNQKVDVAKCNRIATCDLAISEKTTADWTVIQVWDVTPHNHMILVDQWRQKAEGPKIVAAFKDFQAEYNPIAFYVEAVGYQALMIQMLRQDGVPVKEIYPGTAMGRIKDKVARSQRAQVKAQSGQIWLSRAEWIEDWKTEICRFPLAVNDDQVDAFCYAAIVASKYPTEPLEPEPEIKYGALIGDTHEYKTSDDMATMMNKMIRLEPEQRSQIAALNRSSIKLRCETQAEYMAWVNAYEKE
jgi:predicted phage terminase large subunit-like protein